jgi:hypothetical protein
MKEGSPMDRRAFLNLGVIMGGTIVFGGVSQFGCSAANTAGRAVPTVDQPVLTSKEENMAKYMRIWINFQTGKVEIVDDENGKAGTLVTIERMRIKLGDVKEGFTGSEAWEILSTYSSPGCKYVRHGDGSYREVCE